MTEDPGRQIYMDHHATTPVLPEVVRAMLPFLTEEFGNPSSSTHGWGRRAAAAVAGAREAVAGLVGAADPATIVFTAGATESNNLALRGLFDALGRPGDGIVTCAIEHEAVLETCAALERLGARVTVLPVDREGRVAPEAVERALDDRTLVVSLMMANNEIGTLQPVEEIASVCRRRGVLFHSDAVQAAGRVPIDVSRVPFDLVSLTAHKMYGPKGVGALYIAPGVRLRPVMTGGGQEGGLRSGTLNVPGIAGFGAAAAAAMSDLQAEARRLEGLRERLWSALSGSLDRLRLNGHPTLRLPNNLNVVFEGVEADALLTAVREVAALSTGSACASGTGEGSYVIRAITPEAERPAAARSSVRFGLGRGNDASQVDRVASAVISQVRRLRRLAPGPEPAPGAAAGNAL